MLFGAFLIMGSCGPSVSVTDAWKAPDISESKTDHFVVMARVDDVVGRQRFEQEIVKQLKAGGVDAVESYKKFPDLNLNLKMTPDQIDGLVSKLAKEGINGIVLTVLKDVKSELTTSESGGNIGYMVLIF